MYGAPSYEVQKLFSEFQGNRFIRRCEPSSRSGSLPVQDALDSIEFVSGPADSKWGSERAAMGRALPWNLTYMAIGNEVPQSFLPMLRWLLRIIYGAAHDRAAMPDCILTWDNSYAVWYMREEPSTVDIGT